jgi:tetratricopeptide (TPR) repeat protein
MSFASAGKGRAWVLLGLAVLLIAAVYGNSFQNPFHFDDAHSIQENVYLRSLANIPKFFTDIQAFSPLRENRAYRPLLLVTFAVSHALGGGLPWAYHLITLILHVAGVVLIGRFAEHLMSRSGFVAPSAAVGGLCAAGLFAIHPALSEALNYASARSTVQSSVLLFLALWLYVRSRESGRAGLLVAMNVVLLLALGTKIIAMTLPALIVLWELTAGPSRDRIREVPLRDWVLRLGPPIALSFGFTLLHEVMVGHDAREARSMITPWSYFLTEIRVYLHYMGLFVWPEDLCADRVMTWSQAVWQGPVARAILLNVAIVGWAFSRWKERPIIPFGIAWFYITLAPTSSIMPLSEPATEHRLYVALPGLVFALVGALGPLVERALASGPRRRMAVLGLLGGVALAAGVRTVFRNRIWSDDLALWRNVVEESPDNGRGHLNYGLAAMARGDLNTAHTEFDKCAEVWPGYSFCYINRAVLALRQGRQADAEREIGYAEQLQPGNVYVNLWRGEVELGGKRYPTAEQAYRQTLQIAPGYEGARRGLATALFEQGKLDEARPLLAALAAEGLLLADGWYELGFLAQMGQDLAKAEADYSMALRYDPSHARARYNLAVLHQQGGQLDQAIADYELLSQSPSVSPDALYNFALALKAKGNDARGKQVADRLRRTAPGYPGLASLPF